MKDTNKNLIGLLILSMTFLVSCQPILSPSPAAETVTVTDGLGRDVDITVPVERVVTLSPANVEIMYAIGAGDRVVGRDTYANYPAEVLDIQDVGGPYADINLEVIVSLEPDLVLGSGLTPEEQVQSMQDLGLTVYVVPNPLDLDDLYDNINTLAYLAGVEGYAEELVSEMQSRVAALEGIVSAAEERPLVFYELDGTEPNAPWIPGPGTFIDTLIYMAGGENMGGAFDDSWIQVSAEEILAQDPEIIILGDHNFGVTVEEVSARPGWEAIQAVKDGRVYPFDDDLVGRPGPRLVDGLEELARIIHPELFE